jgi:hypothetical protein
VNTIARHYFEQLGRTDRARGFLYELGIAACAETSGPLETLPENASARFSFFQIE